MNDAPAPGPGPGDELDRAEVMVFLRTASDRQIRSRVREHGVERVLAGLFEGMAAGFAADHGRRAGRLQFVLTDDGQEYVHALDLDAGGAVVAPTTLEGGAPGPRGTVTLDLVRFLQVGVGAQDAARLVLTRRMKVSGDLFWVARTMRGLQGQ